MATFAANLEINTPSNPVNLKLTKVVNQKKHLTIQSTQHRSLKSLLYRTLSWALFILKSPMVGGPPPCHLWSVKAIEAQEHIGEGQVGLPG